MSAFHRTCRSTRDSILALGDILQKSGVAWPWLQDDTVDSCFQRCQSCKAKSRKSPKNCKGWSFSFRGANALKFKQVDLAGHLYSVQLTAILDCRRQTGVDWSTKPFARCNPALEILDVAGSVVSRQHVDLANEGQPGPVWHLQLGGLPSVGPRPPLEHIDVPRWLCMPFDFVLMAELVLHGFFPEQWKAVRSRTEWRMLITESERHLLSHYADRLAGYCGQRRQSPSWLADQCNQASDWNPRPT